MALFRSQVLRQRFLVPKVSSSLVYYVHSHLQYTPSLTAVQKFDLLENDLCKHEPQILINKQHVTTTNRNGSKSADDFHNDIQGNKGISQSWPEMHSNLVTALKVDPFISHTQLALLSLCYDTHKNFRATYQKSIDQKISQEHKKIKLSSVSDQNHDKNEKDSIRTVSKYGEGSIVKDLHTVYTVYMCNKTDMMKKKVQDKCDPLHLATVFDFLREEIPLFFTKRHGYEFYHDNVTFVNGLLGTTFRGLRAYKTSMTSMRIACQLVMTDVTMEILKITKESKDCNIKVRWRVSGVPRFNMFRSRTKQVLDNKRYVDGFSIFEVGEDGLIHCHRLLKLMPSNSTQLDNPLWALNPTAVISLLRQKNSFEMFARQRVEDIEDSIPLCGTS